MPRSKQGIALVLAALFLTACGGSAADDRAPAKPAGVLAKLPSGTVENDSILPKPPQGWTPTDVEYLAAILRRVDAQASETHLSGTVDAHADEALEFYPPKTAEESRIEFPKDLGDIKWQMLFATQFVPGTRIADTRVLRRSWNAENAPDGQLQVALDTVIAYQVTKPTKGIVALRREFVLLADEPSTDWPGTSPHVEFEGTDDCLMLLDGLIRAGDQSSIGREVQNLVDGIDSEEDSAATARQCREKAKAR